MPSRARPRRSARAPGLRDIAERLGVSIGTVDRALHDRGRISEVTRLRVVEAVASLGYKPNLAARSLSSRRPLTIAVCLPRAVAPFYAEVRAGIAEAMQPFAPAGVSIAWHDFARLGEGETAAIRRALRQDPDGLILAPGDPASAAPLIDAAAARRIATVCVTTDAPATRRIAAVTVDPRTSGALVGELVGRILGGRGRMAVVSGSLATRDHAEKLAGLEDACRRFWPGVRVDTVVEAHDDEREARNRMREVLRDRRPVDAVYVATANSVPVLTEIVRWAAARPRGAPRRRITVVTTDLFPALVPYIESGLVAATIHQRPRTQGRMALDAIRRALVDRVEPVPVVQLSPHVVMRSNLHLFVDPDRA